MPYYAVARGLKPGIYNNWNSCNKYVSGYSGAIFKKFHTMQQAQQFMKENSNTSDNNAKSPSFSTVPSTSASLSSYTLVTSAEKPQPSAQLHKSMPRLLVSLDGFDMHPSKFSTGIKHSRSKEIRNYKIYVDGAARGNGKVNFPPSGYGVFYGLNDKRNAAVALNVIDDIAENRPTNQRAELFAIKHALIDIANELHLASSSAIKYEIYSDSQYAQKCLTEWIKSWYNNGWKNNQGKPIANRDIISSSIPILNYINHHYNSYNLGDLQFYHVRGHQGNFGNDWADRLANIGADDMQKDLLTS